MTLPMFAAHSIALGRLVQRTFVGTALAARHLYPLQFVRTKEASMFDHLGIVARDIKSSARLYAYMLAPLGIRLVEKHRLSSDSAWCVFSTGEPQSPFFVVGEGRPSFWTAEASVAQSPIHLSFKAPSREAVDSFHAAGIAHGARDNGAPGIRRHPFYCAFLIDLDGNNVEAGCYLPQAEAGQ